MICNTHISVSEGTLISLEKVQDLEGSSELSEKNEHMLPTVLVT